MKTNNDSFKKQMEKRRYRNIRSGFKLTELKEEAMTEAFSSMILRCNAYGEPFDEQQVETIKHLTRNMIITEGTHKILGQFRTKSFALSESVRIIENFVNEAKEQLEKEEDPDMFILDVETKTKFYKELEGIDMEEAEMVISKRVRNNTYDYITNSLMSRDRIEDIINMTREKLSEYEENRGSERDKSRILGEAARLKSQVLNDSKLKGNSFGKVVSNLTAKAYTDKTVGEKLALPAGGIDMAIVDKTGTAVYTFLEAVNGLKMATITFDNMDEYIKL